MGLRNVVQLAARCWGRGLGVRYGGSVEGGQGRDDVGDFCAGGVVGVDVDPADDSCCVDGSDGGHREPGGSVAVELGPGDADRPLRLGVSSAGAVSTPSAAATLFPGSDSTVKLSSFFSCIVIDPSGFCGLIAISTIPR